MAQTLFAGFARMDITPPVGVWLLGCEGPSDGIHDPLYATVLALQLGDQRHILISLDLIGFSREEGDAIRATAARSGDTQAEHVTLMCSHTHSAPFTIPWSITGWNNYRANETVWTQQLHKRIARAVESAVRDMSVAQLGVARADVQIGQNRRTDADGYAQMLPNPDGSIVPWSDVITIRDVHGALRGVLYSQAAHPVMIHKASRSIGADYPGYAAQRIRRRLGDGVMPMFAQSCGADNNAPWATGYAECERRGRQLGDAVADACARATPIPTPSAIVSETAVLDLPLKPLPAEEDVLRTIADLQGLPVRADAPLSRDPLLVAQEQLRLLRAGNAPRFMPQQIQVLAFGAELAVVALSNEIFSGYQLAIDANSPFKHTAVWAHCNSSENYIPTDAEHRRGGYELTDGPHFYPWRSGPAEGTQALLLHAVDALLARAMRRI